MLTLDPRHVTQIPVQAVVRILPHSAGIEDDHVGIRQFLVIRRCRDQTGLLQQAGDPLGIMRVHLAPVGDHLIGAGRCEVRLCGNHGPTTVVGPLN